MYPCLLLKVRSTAVRLWECVCVPVRGPGEGIHAQVTSQSGSRAPGKTRSFTLVEVPVGTLHTGGGNLIPGVLHTGEGDRSFSGTLRSGEDNQKKNSSGLDPSAMASHSASPFEHGEGDDDYLLHGNESYVANHRHLNELHRLSAFQQVTTKVPPSFDGRSSWFAYVDAIDDWCDITELDNDKRRPALRNRLEGEAAIHKRLLHRDRLKDPNNGVKYFKSFLRPVFVKGTANVFLYRFQQFMNLHRGNGDMLRWITRFQLSIQRMQEAWNDTYLPITDPNNAEVTAFIAGLPADVTPEAAIERANARLQDQHARTIPIKEPCCTHLCLSIGPHAGSATGIDIVNGRVLADYRLNELREVNLEIFCTTKTSVDNPLPPSGRKIFLVIDEGYITKEMGRG